jgi:hypothetical protein
MAAAADAAGSTNTTAVRTIMHVRKRIQRLLYWLTAVMLAPRLGGCLRDAASEGFRGRFRSWASDAGAEKCRGTT